MSTKTETVPSSIIIHINYSFQFAFHGNLDLHIKLVQFDPKPRSYFSIARKEKDDSQNLGDSSLPKVVDCLRSLLGINRIDTSDFKIKAKMNQIKTDG
jgi:hypothetical protein